MNRRVPATLAALLAFVCVASPALAQQRARGLTQTEAVRLSVSHNPSLQAAMIDVQRSEAQVRAEDWRFVPVLQLDGGYTHSEGPRLQRDGGVTISSSDTFSVGSQLSHTFRTGTQLSLRVEGYRSSSKQQLTPGSDASVSLGPSYGTVGRLTLVQPFLRGAGTDFSEAALRQARLSRTSAQRAQDAAASQLLRDTLTAYWELWYRSRAVEIDEQAVEFAEKQREDAVKRAQTGALAPADVLSYDTRVAELQEALETARAQRRQQAVELTRLLGTREFGQDLYASSVLGGELQAVGGSREAAVQAALTQSPDLARLEADVAAAQDRVTTAGESERPRLDMEAYVQSERLAYREVPPALDHVSERPAFSAHVGLVFELPLSGAARSADRRAAELAVDAARSRLRDKREQIESQVWSQFVQAETAERRTKLAEVTVRAARQQVDAARKRYESGAAIFIEVQQAEDSLRKSELGVERARSDLAQAILQLRNLTGALLVRYAHEVPRTAASQREVRSARAYAALHRPGAF
jgi:outer membrane protein TolC